MGEGGVREIHLRTGHVALVDAADFDMLSAWKWRTLQNSKGHGYVYAVATGRKGTDDTATVFLHRLLTQAPRGLMVDHINGDGLDNRRANLRVCTSGQNTTNSRKRLGCKNALKGVALNGKRWAATIRHDGQVHHLGRFRNPEAAAVAYDDAARRLHGEFARVNFPAANENREAA